MQTSWVPFFPDSASSFSWQVDWLYFYLILVSVVFTIPIIVAIFIFGLKYRERQKFAVPEGIHGSVVLETVWSIIPFLVSMTIFVGGAYVYYNQYRLPDDGMEIYVVGKQWMWKIQHESGQREINELHVPVDTNIKLTMTTEDAIHSFFVPAFRTKMDAVPGRYTYMWFNATKPGKYQLFCAEYCGLNHSGMIGYVYVMSREDFAAWQSGNVSGQTPTEQGRDLFENKLGCASCHAGGPQQRGAKLEGIFGHEVKLTGGGTVVADEAYIRESILNPGAKVVEGFQPIMPTFKGQVTEEQLLALIAYIKSLSGVTTPAGSSPSGGSSPTTPAANSTAANAANSGKAGQPEAKPSAPGGNSKVK